MGTQTVLVTDGMDITSDNFLNDIRFFVYGMDLCLEEADYEVVKGLCEKAAALEPLSDLIDDRRDTIIFDTVAHYPYSVQAVQRVPRAYQNDVDGITCTHENGRSVTSLGNNMFRVVTIDEFVDETDVPGFVKFVRKLPPVATKPFREALTHMIEIVVGNLKADFYSEADGGDSSFDLRVLDDEIETAISEFEKATPELGSLLFFEDTPEGYVLPFISSDGRDLLVTLKRKWVDVKSDPVCRFADAEDMYVRECPHSPHPVECCGGAVICVTCLEPRRRYHLYEYSTLGLSSILLINQQ